MESKDLLVKNLQAGGSIINQEITKPFILEQLETKPGEVLVETPQAGGGIISLAKVIAQSKKTFAAQKIEAAELLVKTPQAGESTIN